MLKNILNGDYIFKTSCEQVLIAEMLMETFFKGKSLDETLKRIDEITEVLDFIHRCSSQDMTWLVSTIHILGKIIAYRTKNWDTTSVTKEFICQLENEMVLKFKTEVYIEQFNIEHLEKILDEIEIALREIYLELDNKLQEPKKTIVLV